MEIAVVMPVLNPDNKMTEFLDSLLKAGFQNIVIVNDGSSAETVHYFEEAALHPQVTVLTHPVNMGKGKGLKTAFAWLIENRPDIAGAVTVDGDGQHDVKSIRDCLARFEEVPDHVVLGSRDFDDPIVPPRSVFGNKVSRKVYKYAIGIRLNDTQTGLRVIPARHFGLFSELKGDRYEYETNMLVAIVNANIPYCEVPIKTIYINKNAASHFKTVRDAVRIYVIVLGCFLKFTGSSFASFLVDLGVYALIMWLFDKGTGVTLLKICEWLGARIAGVGFDNPVRTACHFVAIVCARVISATLNYILNRNVVFKTSDNVGRTARRYYLVAFCQMLASFLLTDMVAGSLLGVKGILDVLIKCLVDGCLFILSFGIQRKWVFENKKQ
ncbi:MAG: glycosyltransferase [Lachnospiraceae bacterium]